MIPCGFLFRFSFAQVFYIAEVLGDFRLKYITIFISIIYSYYYAKTAVLGKIYNADEIIYEIFEIRLILGIKMLLNRHKGLV